MNYQKIDGNLFTKMILEGALNLRQYVKEVDALNVFPVPDGDTGTNMNLSLTAGVNELIKKSTEHVGRNADVLAKGLLMGARGNSGVILSQLFRGLSKHISSFAEINSLQFAEALKLGVDTAYKAVMKPVEGTILTVSREAAEEAIKTAKRETSILRVMEATLKRAKISLAKTPDLLPILKEVGVVDAGGQGLLHIYEGFLAVLRNEKLSDHSVEAYEESTEQNKGMLAEQPVQAKIAAEEIEYGYCTEFIIRLNEKLANGKEFDEARFRATLSEYGDSLVVVADDEIVKVHIHSEEPGSVLNQALSHGSLHNIKIDNMREQHSHILTEEEEQGQLPTIRQKQPYGIIAVAMGKGIEEIFKSLGVDVVISGGQTMNPSTEDIVNAIKEINADKFLVLPNNSNIILAAEQAASIISEPVSVVPSKTIPQGIAALLSFDPGMELEDNQQTMTEALKQVKTGQVTYAVRDSKYESLEIKEGDFLGIADGKISTTTRDLLNTSYNLLASMIESGEEVVTIIYGADTDEEQVTELSERILAEYPDVELEIHNGGQPIYYFIFSID